MRERGKWISAPQQCPLLLFQLLDIDFNLTLTLNSFGWLGLSSDLCSSFSFISRWDMAQVRSSKSLKLKACKLRVSTHWKTPEHYSKILRIAFAAGTVTVTEVLVVSLLLPQWAFTLIVLVHFTGVSWKWCSFHVCRSFAASLTIF